jgi:hypothetical protein
MHDSPIDTTFEEIRRFVMHRPEDARLSMEFKLADANSNSLNRSTVRETTRSKEFDPSWNAL